MNISRRNWLKRGALLVPVFPAILKAQVVPRRVAGFRQSAEAGCNSVAVDVHQTFEFDTVNTTNLEASDSSSLTWSITGGTTLSTSTSGEVATKSCFNGTADTGTRGLAYSWSGAAAGLVTIDLGANYNAVAAGLWIRCVAVPSWSLGLYILSFARADGVLQEGITNSRNQGNNDNILGGYVVDQDEWYWASLYRTTSSTVRFRLYNTSGTEVYAPSDSTATGDTIRYVNIFGTAATSATLTSYVDDLVIDYTSPPTTIAP